MIARGLEYPKRTGQEQKKGTPAESPGRVGTLSNYFFILFVDGLFDWCGRCKLCGLRRDDDNEEGGDTEAKAPGIPGDDRSTIIR